MCRSKSEVPGGRRCFYHQFTERINRLEATLNRKEQELASLYMMKMKPAAVRKRILELEAIIARKRSHLAQLELRDNPTPTHEEEIANTKEDIKILTNELEDLRDIEKKSVRQVSRRIRAVKAQISAKQEELEELKRNADAAKAQQDAEAEARAAAAAEKEQNERDLRRLLVEDTQGEDAIPNDFHFLLTPEEKELADELRGDEPIGEFLIRRSIVSPAAFSTTSAEHLLIQRPPKTRHDKSAARKEALASDKKDKEIVGRKPSVDRRLRSEHVVAAGDANSRAVLRYYVHEKAKAYKLTMNQYARRLAFGYDLYENDGYVGAKSGTARLEYFAEVEARAFIPTINSETGRYKIDSPEQLASFRREYDRQAQREAYEKTAEKFGADVAGTVFSPYFAEMDPEALPFDTHQRAAA